MNRLGDVKINGKPYRIDVRSYRDRDIVDFSPRAGTPGGSVIHSELSMYQPLMQTDWRHGFGFHWYSDAQGYMSTSGNLDTRHDGIVMMSTTSTSSDTNNNAKEGFVTWNSLVWAWGAAGLHRLSGTTWTIPYTTAAVNFAFASGDYLFYCPDGARLRKVSKADSHTDAGNDSDSKDYKWIIMHAGFLYAGVDGTNRVHRDSTSDMSDLEGTTADPDVIYVGSVNDSFPTLGAVVFSGNLYISRGDGLWHLGEDLIARRILDFTNEASADNFRGMVVHNGYLVFPVRDKVYQWNGARISDVTPPRITDTFPYTTYGRFDNFVTMGRFLYCTARTNETTYHEDLLCFDGVGWHKLMRLATSTDSISSMGYDSIGNRLFYHLNASADVTYYIPFQSQSEFPYATFPTTGTHSLISSRLDMGFRRVDKSMPSLLVEASNVSTTQYLKIYYSLDGEDWVAWGDENITVDGITELKLPSGLQTVEFKYIKLRVDFVTALATSSPILEGLTLRFLMRPDTWYGWSFTIPIAKGMDMGETVQNRDVLDVLNDLKEARSSKSPVEFIDLFGERHLVYLSSNVGQATEYDRDEGGRYPNVEYMRMVNLVEVA